MGILLTNRPEFHWFDAAALHLGATPFSLYNTYTREQIEYQLTDARARILVTERAFAERVDGLRCIEHLIVVEDHELPEPPDAFDFDAAWKAVEPGDLLTLIYTSGTTGPPKGVEITHSNMVGTVQGIYRIIDFPDTGRLVSWLPMAHIAERNCTHYLPIFTGFTTTCCPDPRQVVAYLPEVRPTWFFAVPRIWEKLKAAMEAGIEAEQDEAKKLATRWALNLGLRKARGEDVDEDELAKADDLVLSKIRGMLGLDQVESVNVGAAPTPPEVIEFFHAIGIPLAELWGMSETCGAGTCNPPEKVKIGTVGPAAPHVELKLAEDGEGLIKSRVVMAGYRNQPDKTKETIDEDGWLHTGDIGEFDEDKYLKIVDRKKELIINAAGKNMSPANIESHLKSAGPLIGQAIAIGDGQPYNVALVTLDPDTVHGFLKEAGIEADPSDLESLAQNEQVAEAVQAEVDKANDQMARVEQIKKFKILPTEWEPGGDELTPTMKLKR